MTKVKSLWAVSSSCAGLLIVATYLLSHFSQGICDIFIKITQILSLYIEAVTSHDFEMSSHSIALMLECLTFITLYRCVSPPDIVPYIDQLSW